MAHFDPSRPDFAPYGFTCQRWTPTRMRRPDRHNEIEINLLESGSLTYLLGGRRVTIPAGRLAAFWAAIPHQVVEAEGRAAYYVATIPLAWFLQCKFPPNLVQPALHGQILLDPRPDPGDLHRFKLWLEDLRSEPRKRQRPVFLEMEARLLRLALSLQSNGHRARKRSEQAAGAGLDAGPLSKVEEMAGIIAMHYTERLTIEEIGRRVNLHPNYAMNLFKRAFGTTLIDYLTQHRISHAQRLLATTDEKILAIALDSGFGSVSRFNAAFAQACGCSPREYRNRHGNVL
jgi:AraC family transcriptional regulator, melibiose operon regulatory protein